jgi:hypothetical protein
VYRLHPQRECAEPAALSGTDPRIRLRNGYISGSKSDFQKRSHQPRSETAARRESGGIAAAAARFRNAEIAALGDGAGD